VFKLLPWRKKLQHYSSRERRDEMRRWLQSVCFSHSTGRQIPGCW